MLVDKIKNLDNLTRQETYVVQYILENPQDVLKMNCNQLAKASHTSASTIIRLSQKAGYKGYSELKIQYASEYSHMQQMEEELKPIPYEKESTIDDIIQTMPLIYTKAIDFTRTMLERNKIIQIINRLKQSERIEIYGDGVNYELAKIAAYKFEEVGVSAYAYTSANWTHVKLLEKNKTNTIAILISHTGKNPGIIDSAKRLKDAHIFMVGIVGTKKSSLSRWCDTSLQIMTTRNTLEFSNVMFTMSTQYIFDIMVASLMIQHYDHLKSITEELREAREQWGKEE